MLPSKKDKQELKKASDVKESVQMDVTTQYSPPEPKLLSDTEAIFFYNIAETEREHLEVPPCTPENISSVVRLPEPFPESFPSFDDLTIPYVREIGIKECMHVLGEYLHCTNYAFDYLQFWFIDILVDCLWKTQDEYYLCEKEQRMVLEWIVYAFKIIIDPKMCISRKHFFKLFKEMIFMAADVLNEGTSEIPLPNKLFTLVPGENEKADKPEEVEEETSENSTSCECPSDTSCSTMSFSTCTSQEVIELGIGEQSRMYTIKRKKCFCHMEETSVDKYDFPTSLTSSFMSTKMATLATLTTEKGDSGNIQCADVSANNLPQLLADDNASQSQDEVPQFPNKDYKIFHQPNANIPKRFLPLSSSSSGCDRDISVDGYLCRVESDAGGEFEDANYMNTDKSRQNAEATPKTEDELVWKNDNWTRFSKASSTKPSLTADGSKMGSRKSFGQEKKTSISSKVMIRESTICLNDEEIMQRLQKFKLWEKHIQDMSDPRVGWYIAPEDATADKEEPINVDEEDWEELVNSSEINKQDVNLYIGFGVLCAIVDFVFDYFYRNFHFTLLKLATRTNPTVITQKLNMEWKVPKATREQFTRPKYEKKKLKKEKPPKQPKASKSPKKEGKKDKAKDSKKSSDKKSKKSSEKSGAKKEKKEKPKKLTKEEKAELDKQRKLQEEIEAGLVKLEENKRFVFPLADAATDEFFMGIFDDWQKPKEVKSKDKKK